MLPSRSSMHHIGIEGALITIAPFPLILACASINSGLPPLWQTVTAIFAVLSYFVAAFFIFRRALLGKCFGGMALAGTIATAIPYFVRNPFAALFGSVLTISAVFILKDIETEEDNEQHSTYQDRCLLRARWSSLTIPLLVVTALIVNPAGHILANGAIAAAATTSLCLFLLWGWGGRTRFRFLFWLPIGILAYVGLFFAFMSEHIRIAAIILGLILFLLPQSTRSSKRIEQWWEPFIDHPARILFSTFLGLGILGTLLLQLPGASRLNTINLIDAAFTSVSAVCVTGLVVLDTPHDFSLFGQALILLLIQLGGLGIMTITTVALHAMGRRLSFRHERILATMADAERHDLVASLFTILRFTFAVEATGALILSSLFISGGESIWLALWRGVFTSISAFCNAGFALQSDSLISYQRNPLVLHAVSTLIIFGGMAPATSLIVPKWIRRRPIPIAANITLITTAILLFSGTFFILALEWNGTLAGLSVFDKIHNAWFQSATLRTAGFNTIEIHNVMNPTFLIMLCFMFIGGSPGGTAGGVKTTTIGILAMTFWANVKGQAEVVAHHRRISPGTINRAVTIICSGVLVWFIIVLMLEITQQISARAIIFEATSAIGTVGLSTGATSQLDGIGKIIITIAMFVGRIGPITMFMLLSEDRSASESHCPDAQINLT